MSDQQIDPPEVVRVTSSDFQRQVEAEYQQDPAYRHSCTGVALGTIALCSANFGTFVAFNAAREGETGFAIGAGIFAGAWALGAAKTFKETIMGSFRSGYRYGHRNALNEVEDEVVYTVRAYTTPSNN